MKKVIPYKIFGRDFAKRHMVRTLFKNDFRSINLELSQILQPLLKPFPWK